MSIGAIIRRIYLPTFEGGILPFLVIVQPFNMHPYIGNAIHSVTKKCCCIFVGNNSLQMLEIISRSLFRHAIHWDLFSFQLDVDFVLNVDLTYFVNLIQSGGITSEPWLTDTLFSSILTNYMYVN